MKRLSIILMSVCVVCAGISLGFPLINGDFSQGSTGWDNRIAGDGTVTYPPEYLDVVGADDGTADAYNSAYQSITPPAAMDFTFDLLYYTSSDSSYYDIPYLSIDGNIYCLNTDGTIDWSTYLTGGQWRGGDATPDVNNDNDVSTPISFTAGQVGPGLVTLEFGVFSSDGDFGAGSAGFDNIVVPEPGASVLIGLGIAGLILYRRKKK